AEQASQDSHNSSGDQRGATPSAQLTGANRTGANRTATRPRTPTPPPPRRNWQRTWPLRSGRPPGGKQMGLDPCSAKGRKITELDEILASAHALATGHVP